MKKLAFLFALSFFFLPRLAQAQLVRNDCDAIPMSQRVQNGTLCLQRTTTGGRTAAGLYVWTGAAWAEKATSGTLREIQGTGTEINVTAPTGPVPILSFPGTISIPSKILQIGRLEATSVISPAELTGDENDYNPTDLATAITLRLSTDAARTITGLQGGSDGRVLIIHNIGANPLVLADESGLSSAANRFALNATVTIQPDQSTIIEYDGTSSRWRVISTSSAGGSVDQGAAYDWTGGHTFQRNKFSILDTADPTKILQFDNSGFTNKTTRTWSGPDASTRLLGDSDFSGTGIMTRTGPNAYAARTLNGTANRITVTNPSGIAGSPTFNLGSLAVQTDQSNTFSTGDQDFGNALSLKLPVATDAAPTVSGRCAYDSTANRYKCGVNGSTITIPSLAEVQPVNANLTALAGLAGVNNTVPIFTGAGTLALGTLPSCIDAGGNHLNYDATSHAWSCGTTSSGGLTGLVTGKFLIATGATAADTSGALSEAGGIVNAANGFTAGNVSTDYIRIDTSAVTGAKTWTVINFGGTIRPSTGALTPGNLVTTNADGQFIDGGGAGTGTWTDASASTGTNKTFDFINGAGNSIKVPLQAYWDGGSMTPDGASCTAPTLQTINSGPKLYAFSCADNNASTFDGNIAIPATAGTLATVTFTLTVNDVDSAAEHFAGGFKAMCRNNNTAVNNTWGTAQTVDITMGTASNNYTGTTAAVTPDGTCSPGATLFWRFTVDSGTHTDGGNARVIGVMMKQIS